MKKITCAQMGGPCEAEIMGDSAEEMMTNGMAHLQEAHPEMAEKMNAMSEEEKAAWAAEKWEAATEASA